MIIRELLRGAVLLGALSILALAGCSADNGSTSAESSFERSETVNDPPTVGFTLPERDGPRSETSGSVPHIQLDAEPDSVVDAELRRRAFQIPGVQDLPSARSLPGARGLAISDELDLARPDVLGGGREFAHIHPDGSLHVWLPVDRALEVHETKWGESHPWVDRDGFWDGVVMLYTPETLDELDITIQILVDSYNFVTGAALDARDIT
ncbi:MAG: phospholipase [Actinobacteria bacterium]|nr:phospholipase [Actinomycetota bacterium]